MEKNKIALVTYSLSSGGLERVVANSTFLFKELGCQVHLYVLNSTIDYPYVGKLHQYNIDKLTFFSKINAYLKLRKSLKNNDFKLVIDHRYRLNWLTEIIWQKIIYKSEHVVNYVHSFNIYNYVFKNKKINRFLFSNKLFICVSNGIEQKIQSKYPLLKTQTIYNFFDFKGVTENSLNEEKYILMIARMDHENVKQVDVLLECYAKSLLPEKEIRLIILGDGVRLKKMKILANSLNVSHLVDFKGFVASPESYFKHAFFTVLTSKHEGLPTVLIESLMLKTPVISFDCETGPNEIITHRFNGLLVENQNKEKLINAINELTVNEELYKKLKENALASVEKFQFKSLSNQWQNLINDTL